MEKNKNSDSTKVDEETAIFINKNVDEIPEEELALKCHLVSIKPQKNNHLPIKDEKILLIPRNCVNLEDGVELPFDSLSIIFVPRDDNNKLPATVYVEVIENENTPFNWDEVNFFKNYNANKDDSWIEWSNQPGQSIMLLRPSNKIMFGDGFFYGGCNHKSWFSSAKDALIRFIRWPETTVYSHLYFVSRDLLRSFPYLSLSAPCDLELAAIGTSYGFVSTKNHQLKYSLTVSSTNDLLYGNRRQGVVSLLSNLYYTFTVDKRDSTLRPTQGYALQSATTLSGLPPDDYSTLRFLLQEFHMCYALPLGYSNAGLNLGFSGGVLLPWRKSGTNRPLFYPQILLSENSSIYGSMGELGCLWKLRYGRVNGPNIRIQTRDDSNNSLMSIALNGDLAISAFADLSFDLPMKVFQDKGIQGHIFASAGSILKLKEIKPNRFSLNRFIDSFRTSVKCGIVLPIKNRFNVEVNICHILEKPMFNERKFGLQLCFSTRRS